MEVKLQALLSLLGNDGADDTGFFVGGVRGVDGQIMAISGPVCVIAFGTSSGRLCLSYIRKGIDKMLLGLSSCNYSPL